MSMSSIKWITKQWQKSPSPPRPINKAYRHIWEDPLSESWLGILVHECAHEKAGHHGDDFRKEVERMAGKLATICLQRGPEIIERWKSMGGEV